MLVTVKIHFIIPASESINKDWFGVMVHKVKKQKSEITHSSQNS